MKALYSFNQTKLSQLNGRYTKQFHHHIYIFWDFHTATVYLLGSSHFLNKANEPKEIKYERLFTVL